MGTHLLWNVGGTALCEGRTFEGHLGRASVAQAGYDDHAMNIFSLRSLRIWLLLLLLIGFASSFAGAQPRPEPNPQLAAKELNARVEALLKKMTLDEKIGQLVQYSAGFATGPNASNLTYEGLVAKGQVGSMLNVVGSGEDQPLPAHRDGEIASAYPHSFWPGRDSRSPDDLPCTPGGSGRAGTRRRLRR